MKYLCSFNLILLCAALAHGRIEFDLYKTSSSSEDASGKRWKRYVDAFDEKPVWTNDSVDLFKFLNSEYYGEIQVGSPAKKFKVMFDTTWADTFLPSSHCSWAEISCKMHNQYDSSKSSTYKPNGRFINVTNNELGLEGMLSTDTFHLAHVKLEDQTFLEATHMSYMPFIAYKADGVIGLAFVDHSAFKNVTPFFYNLVKQQVIKENVFTFYMNRDATTERAGKVILGGTQRKHVKANTTTELNVIEKKYWKINVDGIYAEINKTSTMICEKCQAVFDSSANTIVGPPDQIKTINYMLNAVFIPYFDKYAIKCRDYAKLPDFHFVLNGMHYVIQSKYYVQRMVWENIEACFSPFMADPNPTTGCWTLGGAFMMEFYTEFNMDKDMIFIGQTVF